MNTNNKYRLQRDDTVRSMKSGPISPARSTFSMRSPLASPSSPKRTTNRFLTKHREADKAETPMERSRRLKAESVRFYTQCVKWSALTQMVASALTVATAILVQSSEIMIIMAGGLTGFFSALFGFVGAEYKLKSWLYVFFVLDMWAAAVATTIARRSGEMLAASRQCEASNYMAKQLAYNSADLFPCDRQLFILISGLKVALGGLAVIIGIFAAYSAYTLSEHIDSNHERVQLKRTHKIAAH